jgi:O-antigen ligase
MAGNILKRNLSVASKIWLVLAVCFLSVLTAWRPEYMVAVILLLVFGILMHSYLHSSIPSDETFERVYPRRFAAVTIVVFLFMPHLIYTLGDLGLVIMFGIPLLVLLFANYHALASNNFKFKTNPINMLLFMVILSIIGSTFFGVFVKGEALSWRDFLELKAPVYYFLVFNLFFQIEWASKEIEKYFLRPFIVGGVATVIIGIIQFLQVPGLNENVFVYWTEEHHLYFLMMPNVKRIFSTFNSPGVYGSFLVFLIAHIIALYFSSDRRRRFLTGFYLLMALVALIMTGTKTSFVLFLILIVIFPLIFFRQFRYKLVSMATMIITLALLTMFLWPWIQDSPMIVRMTSFSNSVLNVARYGTSVKAEEYLDETSISRVALWYMAWPRIVESPIMGWGPGKQFLRTEGYLAKEGEYDIRFDSSYLQIVVRYGLVGIFFNFAVILYMMFIQGKVLKLNDTSSELRRVSSAHYAFGWLLLIAFLTWDFIYNIQIMAPLFASAGISASCLFSIAKQKKT